MEGSLVSKLTLIRFVLSLAPRNEIYRMQLRAQCAVKETSHEAIVPLGPKNNL